MKFSHVTLHYPMHVPTMGEFKRTLNQQFYPGIDMKAGVYGVLCTLKGKAFLVPWTCVQSAVVEEGDKK